MQLSNIPGNFDVKKNLIDRVHNNNPATKILFIDKDGYGSLALAIAYAKFLSCVNKNKSDSCNECSNCKKYNILSHPDLHFSYPFFINKPKNINYCLDIFDIWQNMVLNQPFFSITDWASNLQERNNNLIIPAIECINKINTLALKPYASNYKIFIIWQAEYLKKNANILLKLIEESNNDTVIIAISSDKDNLLPTFASRFEYLTLKPINRECLKIYTIKNHQIDTKSIEEMINKANGSIVRLSQYIYKQNDNYEFIIKWLRLCYKGDILELINTANSISYKNKELQKNILLNILDIIQEGVFYKYSCKEVSLNDKSLFINNFIKLFDIKQLNDTYHIINEAIIDLEKNINSKILFLDVSLLLNKILKNR